MHYECFALGCKSRWSPESPESNLLFHRFPKDEQRQKQWLDSVPIKGKLYKSATLCSLHFSEDDYDSSGRLKRNTCPRVATADGDYRLLNKDNVDDIVIVEKSGYFAICKRVTNLGPKGVQPCLGCLDTGGGQVDLCGVMEEVFCQLTGLLVQKGSLCRICLQLLRKFSEFRQRCRDINEVLVEIPVVTREALKSVDRKYLKHNYSRSDLLNIVCDPCIPEKSDTLIEENLNDINDDIKLESDNVKSENISISDNDNEFNEKFEIKNNINHESSNLYDDMVTVVDEEANKTINCQEESDDDFKWPENNDCVQEDANDNLQDNIAKINRKPGNNGAKKPYLEDEKLMLRHRRFFGRLKKSFGLNEDPIELFEKIHKESVLLKSGQSCGEETVSKSKNMGDRVREAALKRNIRNFLDLNNQYGELLGVDVDFVSLHEQKRAMDSRRERAPPAPFCGLCCKSYNHADTYQRHLQTAHNKNHPLECAVCKYRLPERQLFPHLLRHARRFTCRECGAAMFMTTPCVTQVKRHVSTHRARGQSYSCELCGKKLACKKSYYAHMKNVHSNEVNSVKCQLCDDTFYQDNGLRMHMHKMHSQAAQCSVCAVWFMDRRALHAHTEDGCRPHQHSPCPGCGSNFESAALMKEHYLEVHKKYTCHVARCQKKTLGLQAYYAHRNESHAHLKKKKKRKKPENNLQINPSLVCETCGKNNFVYASTLREHQRLHTGEKPFTCDYCSRQFRIKQQLLVHISAHMGQRRYKCKLCTKSFRQDCHLRVHLRTHTMERPYPCDVCGRRFAVGGNRNAHRRTVHEGFPPRKRPKRVRSEQTEDVA